MRLAEARAELGLSAEQRPTRDAFIVHEAIVPDGTPAAASGAEHAPDAPTDTRFSARRFVIETTITSQR